MEEAMSGHADTIRLYIEPSYGRSATEKPSCGEALVSLDMLLAENQRLREALRPMAREDQRGFVAGSAQTVRQRAREALAGDGE
jgi:hypothetical protein